MTEPIVVDVKEVLRMFAKNQARLKPMVKEANLAAADIVAEHARELVPRRSGALWRSIRAAGQQNDGVVRAGWRKEGVVYAAPIHFGWPRRNIIPQPFLYDALDQRRSEVFEEYRRQIEKLVKESQAPA